MAKLVLSVRPNMAALYTFQAIRIRHPFTTNYSSIHTLALGLGVSRQRGLLLNPIANVSGSELRSCGRRGRGLGRIGVRASSTYHVNESGSIDSPLIKSMEIKIKEQLNAESVIVKDAYGDGRHVSIDVISSGFEGQSAVQRQRMVYKAIWEELQNTVHAVDQMTTKTPAEAGTSK